MGTLYTKRGIWHYSIVCADGTRRSRSTRTRDRDLAEVAYRAAEREEWIRTNVPGMDRQMRTAETKIPSLPAILDEYFSAITFRGSEKHLAEQRRIVCLILNALKVTDSSQLNKLASGFHLAISGLSKSHKWGATTTSRHAGSVRRLEKWMVSRGYLEHESLKSIDLGPRIKSFSRRPLTIEEWRFLKANLRRDTWASDAKDRITLYQTAIATGYRASELRRLKRADLIHTSTGWCLRLDTTKNKRPASQRIGEDLASRLHSINAADSTYLFPWLPERIAGIWHSDREWCRRKYVATGGDDDDFLARKDSSGRRLDFHALRHTCGAWLALKGMHPKVIQDVMRHSSITLTLDTYGHLFPVQQNEAIDCLTSMLEL